MLSRGVTDDAAREDPNADITSAKPIFNFHKLDRATKHGPNSTKSHWE